MDASKSIEQAGRGIPCWDRGADAKSIFLARDYENIVERNFPDRWPNIGNWS